MNDGLISALRRLGAEGLPDCFRAADALEAQAARIAELEGALRMVVTVLDEHEAGATGDGFTHPYSHWAAAARAALAPKERA
jgi:hypothetical protein